MKNKGFLQIGFFIISILLVLAVGILAFFFGRGDISLKDLDKKEELVSLEETEEEIVSTPNMSLEIEAIKQAVFEKTGLNSENADVTVSQYTLDYAKGGVKEKEAIGGAYFIAAKENGKWVCVYDGQSHPTCEQIELYDFPKEMVPECLDSSNNVVER